jgi:lipopolysaccharide export LptBFGC system permease protein LptF
MGRRHVRKGTIMGFLLWIIAVALVIYGIITLFNGSVLLGVLLIIVGLAVGPGGWTIFNRRGTRA